MADELRSARHNGSEDYEPREPHVQRIDEADIYQLPSFGGVQFVAHLRKDIRIGANGDMDITFTVPFKFKHLAYPLTDVMARPLSVDVQTWQPYDKAMKDT